MSYELRSARFLARDVLLRAVQPGDTVVDATMGNGHDTLFLAEQVGAEGRVYAFDIQESAVESTRHLLEEHGMSGRVTLLCRSHAEMAGAVPSGLAAAVFNLGWLPGGDHSITTLCASTEKAVLSALDLLASLLSGLSNRIYNVLRQTFLNAGQGAPECFIIQKL